jgi:tRNA(Leu) C34 or U34 (ribose-2'-O)-methylase TrmL
VLINPKYPHNVGAAVRAASCYGIGQVWFTGDRVQLIGERRFRLPREERMRGYQDVDLRHSDLPFEAFDARAVPVAVELRRSAESLIDFVHPEHAVYVFGPEDDSLDRAVLRVCHRFVAIPTGTAPIWLLPSTPCSMTGTPSESPPAWNRLTRSSAEVSTNPIA